MEKEDNRPFAERHPKLNLLLGLLLILGFGYVVVIACIFAVEKLTVLFSRLSTIASKLDVVVIVALITGAVSILSVVFSSVIAKSIEYKQRQREYLYQKREEPYTEFVAVVYKILEKTKRKEEYTDEELTTDINRFSQKLTLWGSNRVIKKWLKFRSSSSEKNKTPTEVLFVMEDILFAMRKDLGLKKMKQGNLLSFFVNDINAIKGGKGESSSETSNDQH